MKVRITMTGTSPILLHNVQLASPLNPYAKRLKVMNAKRIKTDDDREAVARLEWEAGWYWDELLGPVLPTASIRKCLIEGAKLTRAGKKIERGVVPLDIHSPILYEGPRDLVKLWGDGIGTPFVDLRSVGVQQNKVDRCRPQVKQWTIESSWLIETTVIDSEEFTEVAKTAGVVAGVGDGRAIGMGRFEADVEEIG